MHEVVFRKPKLNETLVFCWCLTAMRNYEKGAVELILYLSYSIGITVYLSEQDSHDDVFSTLCVSLLFLTFHPPISPPFASLPALCTQWCIAVHRTSRHRHPSGHCTATAPSQHHLNTAAVPPPKKPRSIVLKKTRLLGAVAQEATAPPQHRHTTATKVAIAPPQHHLNTVRACTTSTPPRYLHSTATATQSTSLPQHLRSTETAPL